MSTGLLSNFATGTATVTVTRPGGTVNVSVTTSVMTPTLPLATPTTTVPANAGTVHTCTNDSQLTTALASVANGTWPDGDIIELTAGNTFSPFTLPAKPGNGWIIIRSSAYASLPARGTQVHPSDAFKMPLVRITTNSTEAINTAASANGYWLLGLEVAADPAVTSTYNLLSLGNGDRSVQTLFSQAPQNLALDRCYIHGNQGLTFQRTVGLNSGSTTVVDCYISEAHHTGSDAQGICGWNGPGPFNIQNNYIEGSGENVMFGGSGSAIAALAPQDITMTGNWLYKPPAWDRSVYPATGWEVKSHFEIKSGTRCLVSGNILENCWSDAQDGTSTEFKSVNQDNNAPWSICQDVTFKNNIIRNTIAGISCSGSPQYGTGATAMANRIAITNNLFYKMGNGDYSGGNAVIWSNILGLTYSHNTTDSANYAGYFQAGLGLPMTQQLVFNDNICNGLYGIGSSDGNGAGITGLKADNLPGWACNNNVVVNGTNLPSTNFIPASWAAINLNPDYSLPGGSPYLTASTTGGAIGADISAITTATSGVDANNKALVGSVVNTFNNSVATTPAAAPSMAVTAHNLLVVTVSGVSATPAPALTDTAGNTFTLVKSDKGASNYYVSVYYAKNCLGNAGNVVTFTDTGTQYKSITVAQFSGCSTAAPLDMNVSGHGTASGTYTTPRVDSGSANEVYVIAAMQDQAGGTLTLPASFTASAQNGHKFGYQFIRSGYNQTYTVTDSAGTGTVSAIVALFK